MINLQYALASTLGLLSLSGGRTVMPLSTERRSNCALAALHRKGRSPVVQHSA